MELTNKAKIVVLFANAYDMQDDRGRSMTGCSVHYLFWGEDGEALISKSEFNPAKPVGYQRAKCSMDYDLREKLVVAPALYEGTFVTVTGGDGKPVLKLKDVAFISHLDFVPRIIPGFVVPGMVDPAIQYEMAGLSPNPEALPPAAAPAGSGDPSQTAAGEQVGEAAPAAKTGKAGK
ncbi:MAG: hypothetical protein NC399_11345 [Muribaculum sp.]|nr:hypothetical protein [Muribaculum sp.]